MSQEHGVQEAMPWPDSLSRKGRAWPAQWWARTHVWSGKETGLSGDFPGRACRSRAAEEVQSSQTDHYTQPQADRDEACLCF